MRNMHDGGGGVSRNAILRDISHSLNDETKSDRRHFE